MNSTGLPGMQGQTAELQKDQNIAADSPDESSISLPKHGEIYESILLIPPEAPPACIHTHTPRCMAIRLTHSTACWFANT